MLYHLSYIGKLFWIESCENNMRRKCKAKKILTNFMP
jgi:hypothetical protein